MDNSITLLVTSSGGIPIIYHYSGAFGTNGVALLLYVVEGYVEFFPWVWCNAQ